MNGISFIDHVSISCHTPNNIQSIKASSRLPLIADIAMELHSFGHSYLQFCPRIDEVQKLEMDQNIKYLGLHLNPWTVRNIHNMNNPISILSDQRSCLLDVWLWLQSWFQQKYHQSSSKFLSNKARFNSDNTIYDPYVWIKLLAVYWLVCYFVPWWRILTSHYTQEPVCNSNNSNSHLSSIWAFYWSWQKNILNLEMLI